MIASLLALADTLLFGAVVLSLVLGISCIAMAVSSTKTGPEMYKERIEYGFFGVSSLSIMAILIYAIL